VQPPEISSEFLGTARDNAVEAHARRFERATEDGT
jgi:hypothetical protein